MQLKLNQMHISLKIDLLHFSIPDHPCYSLTNKFSMKQARKGYPSVTAKIV